MNEFTPLEKLHVRPEIQATVLDHYSRKQEQVASSRQPIIHNTILPQQQTSFQQMLPA
jgi:hypothetical protein